MLYLLPDRDHLINVILCPDDRRISLHEDVELRERRTEKDKEMKHPRIESETKIDRVREERHPKTVRERKRET